VLVEFDNPYRLRFPVTFPLCLSLSCNVYQILFVNSVTLNKPHLTVVDYRLYTPLLVNRSTEASFYIYGRPLTDTNVIASVYV